MTADQKIIKTKLGFLKLAEPLEKAKEEKEAHGEIETQHPGYLGLRILSM